MDKCILAIIFTCGLAASASVAQAQQKVSIGFGITVGGKQVGCGAGLEGLGADRRNAELNEAKLYVHNVALVGGDGKRTPVKLDDSEWQHAGVALLDFKDARGGRVPCSSSAPAKNTRVLGQVPAGAYTGLEFSVGVPVDAEVGGKKIQLNHSNFETAPAPFDVVSMNWSWQAGRKFIAIEVNPAGGFKRPDGSSGRTWMVHLGSTACSGNPATGEIVECKQPNRFTVAFDRFDVAKDIVEIDLTTLFKDSDLTQDRGGAVGCMSGGKDPECPAIFAALGLNLAETQAGTGDAGQQTRAGISPIFKVLKP